MTFQFMKENRSTFEVEKMCQMLQVSQSGYYAWRKRAKSKHQEEDEKLLNQIKEVYAEGRFKYGSPKITAILKHRGHKVGHNRVARLMRENQLHARKRRKKIPITTQSNHAYRIAPNLLKRQFHAEEPNGVWTSDITYIPTAEGWLYLCVILDLYSRVVVGWSMRTDLKTELATEAFQMALTNRHPKTALIFHSDRGIQYASDEFQHLLDTVQVTQSMSKKGDCLDNAVSESFWSILKFEAFEEAFETRKEARIAIFEYIEVFYNRLRVHSTLGYVSPIVFEQARVSHL